MRPGSELDRGRVRPAEDDRNIRYLAHMKFEFLRFMVLRCFHSIPTALRSSARGAARGVGLEFSLIYVFLAALAAFCPCGRPWCGLTYVLFFA